MGQSDTRIIYHGLYRRLPCNGPCQIINIDACRENAGSGLGATLIESLCGSRKGAASRQRVSVKSVVPLS
jgi:hypothetical protein